MPKRGHGPLGRWQSQDADKNCMAQLWISNDAGNWENRSLDSKGGIFAPTGAGLEIISMPAKPRPGEATVLLLRPSFANGTDEWILLAGQSSDVHVNGEPLHLGVRALRDKDAISIAGERLFFSTEQLACVTPFRGGAEPAFCPRCKQRLEDGVPAVECPRCHVWHHQSEKYPCWTYDTTCACCQLQATALDAGFSWTPEDL